MLPLYIFRFLIRMNKLYYIQIAFFIAGFLFSHLKIAGQPGILDLTFNQGEGPNDDILPIAIQPDGKILIGGSLV